MLNAEQKMCWPQGHFIEFLPDPSHLKLQTPSLLYFFHHPCSLQNTGCFILIALISLAKSTNSHRQDKDLGSVDRHKECWHVNTCPVVGFTLTDRQGGFEECPQQHIFVEASGRIIALTHTWFPGRLENNSRPRG